DEAFGELEPPDRLQQLPPRPDDLRADPVSWQKRYSSRLSDARSVAYTTPAGPSRSTALRGERSAPGASLLDRNRSPRPPGPGAAARPAVRGRPSTGSDRASAAKPGPACSAAAPPSASPPESRP